MHELFLYCRKTHQRVFDKDFGISLIPTRTKNLKWSMHIFILFLTCEAIWNDRRCLTASVLSDSARWYGWHEVPVELGGQRLENAPLLLIFVGIRCT